MSWASIVGTPRAVPTTKMTPSAPISPVQDRGSQVSLSAPKASAEQLKTKKSSTVVEKMDYTEEKSSSWAAVAKKSIGAAPVPSKPIKTTETALKSVDTSKNQVQASIEPKQTAATSSWATLPSDVIQHHLLEFLPHASTVRVLRRLCRHWRASVPLRKVFAVSPLYVPPNDAFNHAVEHSESLVLRFYPGMQTESLSQHLSLNKFLHTLQLLWCNDLAVPQLQKLAKIVSSLARLRNLTIHCPDMSAKQTAIILGELQRSASSSCLVSLDITVKSTPRTLNQLLQLVKAKKIEQLSVRFKIDATAASEISEWLASEQCSLQSLTLISFTEEPQILSSIAKGIARNKSLTHLDLSQFQGFSSDILEFIGRNKSIRRLTLQPWQPIAWGPLMKYLLARPRLEFFNANLSHISESLTRESINDLEQVLLQKLIPASIQNLHNWLGLLPSTPLLQAVEDIDYIESVVLQNEHRTQRCLAAIDRVLTHNPVKSIEIQSYGQWLEVELTPFMVKTLKKCKCVQTLIFDTWWQRSLPPAVLPLFQAFKSLKTLQNFTIRNGLDDSIAPSIAALIQGNARLSTLNLDSVSLLTAKGVEQILAAIAKNKHFTSVSITGCSMVPQAGSQMSSNDLPALNNLVAAIFQSNPLLETISFDLCTMDASTINTIIRCIRERESSCSALRLLRLQEVDMPQIVKKNLKLLENEKGGLLEIVLKRRE